ncbi:hypothetical protein P170DRAFT_3246 [Aspergillus steynii IBT 23096]|uniref:Uncharacterized protein n=1 Tax=Aspergillus steynii IBT 23096 TaxID=1392250 RepID=A0A2I2GLH8_9EURO|nr:uncharacterized protein P170DRAFT_3246 [Aspergillus steynii IBT 23096]PLB53725.1 hypothetical protein P170DRAFT_3246 [Aspergillus steynii IBT 23096]
MPESYAERGGIVNTPACHEPQSSPQQPTMVARRLLPIWPLASIPGVRARFHCFPNDSIRPLLLVMALGAWESGRRT